MNFDFKAKQVNGQEFKGRRSAPDRFALAREMREEGLVLLWAEPASNRKKWSWRRLNELTRTVKLNDKILMVSN